LLNGVVTVIQFRVKALKVLDGHKLLVMSLRLQ